MRWTKPKDPWEGFDRGDKRTVTRFLWFPLTIDKETRWLETASYEEEVTQYETGDELGYRYIFWAWKATRWMNP